MVLVFGYKFLPIIFFYYYFFIDLWEFGCIFHYLNSNFNFSFLSKVINNNNNSTFSVFCRKIKNMTLLLIVRNLEAREIGLARKMTWLQLIKVLNDYVKIMVSKVFLIRLLVIWKHLKLLDALVYLVKNLMLGRGNLYLGFEWMFVGETNVRTLFSSMVSCCDWSFGLDYAFFFLRIRMWF